MLQGAVLREIEIIEEASKRLRDHNPASIQAHTEVPFDSAVGLRNVGARGYDTVRLDRIWTVATVLASQLHADISVLLLQVRPDENVNSLEFE